MLTWRDLDRKFRSGGVPEDTRRTEDVQNAVGFVEVLVAVAAPNHRSIPLSPLCCIGSQAMQQKTEKTDQRNGTQRIGGGRRGKRSSARRSGPNKHRERERERERGGGGGETSNGVKQFFNNRYENLLRML